MWRSNTGALLIAMALLAPWPALGEPVPRHQPAAGSVIARKSGEEVRFVDVSNWRFVDLAQDLLPGDVLRTNATGALAVLFRDHTQIRLGRNTALRVKQIGGGDTNLELQSGTIWARAARGGEGLVIDTPAAAAAIRGTDWTMTVGGDGKTSLTVLEGVVELKNAYGSVTVRQGEGAVAAIGSAPTKIIIVTPKDREQMLFHLPLRDAFNLMPPTPLKARDMRRERARIEAQPEASRSAEDWLTLAEIYLPLEGRQRAQGALERARRLGLNRSQDARAYLIEALIAGSENRYSDAARLFAEAVPRLDAKRRSVAAYGGYFARALADPNLVEAPHLRQPEHMEPLPRLGRQASAPTSVRRLKQSRKPSGNILTTRSFRPSAHRLPCCSMTGTRRAAASKGRWRSTPMMQRHSSLGPSIVCSSKMIRKVR